MFHSVFIKKWNGLAEISTGTGGFGGPNPATVGINQGNGTDYIQIGRFDSPGGVFDGPYGNADGIDFLDNQNFILNACISSPGMPNVPPIMMSTQTCDTLTVCENDTLLITGTFFITRSKPDYKLYGSFIDDGFIGYTE